MGAVTFHSPARTEGTQRILESQTGSVTFAAPFRLDTIGACWTFLPALDASLPTCCKYVSFEGFSELYNRHENVLRHPVLVRLRAFKLFCIVVASALSAWVGDEALSAPPV